MIDIEGFGAGEVYLMFGKVMISSLPDAFGRLIHEFVVVSGVTRGRKNIFKTKHDSYPYGYGGV